MKGTFVFTYWEYEGKQENLKKMGIPMKEFAVYLIVKLIFHIMYKENT